MAIQYRKRTDCLQRRTNRYHLHYEAHASQVDKCERKAVQRLGQLVSYRIPTGTTLMLLNGEPLMSFVLTTVHTSTPFSASKER